MKTPDRNYLAAQNKNLIRAGDTLANLAKKNVALYPGGDIGLEEAIYAWTQAKENLMGLAGK